MLTTRQTKLKVSRTARGLIFDLDGTLLDSIGLHWLAWQYACRQYNVELDKHFFMSQTGKPIQEIAQLLIDKYNINASINEILEAKEEMVYANLDSVKIIEPVVAIAKASYGKIPMSVGTGSDHRRAEIMLKKANILHLFDAIVCAEDVCNHKPAPDTFLLCAQLMNVEPKYCQVFEDGKLGLDAATSANMIATDVKPFYNN